MNTGGQVLIVGAGITGLLTAVYCARAGHRVTVLDRGPIPNPASTSFDQHRVQRALDPNDAAATRHTMRIHRHWLELETLLGVRCYRRVGVVTGWPAADLDTVAAAAATGVRIATVEPNTLPHICFPPNSVGVWEFDAGVLLAERVLRAATRWCVGHPAVRLLPGRRVTDVDGEHGSLRVHDGTRMAADLIVLAAGPWSRELVTRPMLLHRQTVAYLRPPADLARWWAGAPSAGRVGHDGGGWLLPPVAGTLLKVSAATLCREVDAIADELDPDERAAAAAAVASVLPHGDRYTTVAVRHCHYLLDADTGAASLLWPGPRLVARAASGGDGFRTAPLIAEHIAAAAAARAAA